MPASAATAKPYNPAAPDWVGQPDVPEFIPQNYNVTPSLKPVSINWGLSSFPNAVPSPSQISPIIREFVFMSPWFPDPIVSEAGKSLYLKMCQWRGTLEVSVRQHQIQPTSQLFEVVPQWIKIIMYILRC